MNLFDQIPARKPRTKKEMIKYLSNHFRYHTLRSSNRKTSYAHNIKIVVKEGEVYLRGPVRSSSEKEAVYAKAISLAGKSNVKNELDIVPK